MPHQSLKLLSANIQAGSSTRGYSDYVARSWSHVLPAGNKRGALDTIAQLAFIAELLHGIPHAVLMGDFNCTLDRPEMALLYQRTRLQPPTHGVLTFPSWRPQRAIDHILATDPLSCHEVRAMPAALSDHLALSIELSVPASALR